MDVIDAAIRAVAQQSALAPGFAFLAGAATAIGPCAAPRMVAAVGLTGSESSRTARLFVLGALVAGLCCAYIAIGYASFAASALMRQSAVLYIIAAIVFAAFGVRTIVGHPTHRCDAEQKKATSLGGAFLLGGSMALVVSPCCTPVIATLVGLGVANGSIGFGIATLAAFALGHALPVVLAGIGASGATSLLARFEAPVATVTGTLLIGLSFYYAVLA